MSTAIVYYENGIPVREWDDDLRVFIERDRNTGETTLQRPYTSEENSQANARAADGTEQINEAELLAKAAQALTVNSAWLNRSSAPTNAQSLAQIDRLTRQVNALIRFQLRDFTDIIDT